MATDSNIWLYPTKATQEYLRRRQRQGDDPYPEPQSEREEIMHRFWLIGVTVAGWWLESTEYLRDLLQKYEVTQAQEAEEMERQAAERIRRQLLGPSQEQIAAGLKDVLAFQKRKRSGIRKYY